MKKIKILIIIFIIIIIALVGAIYMLNRNTKEEIVSNTVNNELSQQELEDELQQGVVGKADENPILSASDYMTLKRCVTSFFNTINQKNPAYYGKDGERTSTSEDVAEMELSLLSESYIKKNNITTKNIHQYIYNIATGIFFIPTQVKKFYGEERVNSFVIKGLVEDMNYKPMMEVLLILNIDTSQATYSIEVLDNNQSTNAIIPTKLEKIDKNDMNEFEYLQLTEENIINELTDVFKKTVLGYPEVFYNQFLAEDYKQAKFTSVNDFKEYVASNKDLIGQINIKEYSKEDNGNTTQYILVDQYQNRYVVNYQSLVSYKMYLDYYTTEIDTFKKNYDEAEDETKVVTQINKIRQMLNMKDYNTIYKKLNATFRNNNFKNVNQLAQYLQKNAYDINTITVDDVEENGDYYVCTCTLTNQKNEQESKNMTIMIKPIDYSNFEMSFNIQ